MRLIVGLGNITKQYENTRHNVGFMLIDELLKSVSYTKITKSQFKGEAFKASNDLYLKPSTYMNLSGESVLALKQFYKIENQDIIVIHDDLDLKLGALKFKQGGSHAGHNGLKSIDSKIGNDYHRIRIGIGRPEFGDVVNYVLGKFADEELQKLQAPFENTKKALNDWGEKTKSKYSLKG